MSIYRFMVPAHLNGRLVGYGIGPTQSEAEEAAFRRMEKQSRDGAPVTSRAFNHILQNAAGHMIWPAKLPA